METTEQQSQPLELGQQNCLVCILLIVNKINTSYVWNQVDPP